MEPGNMNRSLIVIGVALVGVIFIATGCSKAGSNGKISRGTVIKTVTVGTLTATLSNSTGELKLGDQEVMLDFTDSSGQPVDVGAVPLNFHMPQMGSMAAVTDSVAFRTTGTPGLSRGNVERDG